MNFFQIFIMSALTLSYALSCCGMQAPQDPRPISTALHAAAQHGRNDEVTMRLLGGTYADTPNARGQTALHGACMFCHIETITTLLEYNADPNIVSDDGTSPLLFVTLSQKSENEKIEAMKVLLSYGASITAQNEINLQMPLIRVASDGLFELSKFLIEQGADIYAAENDGNTALHLAASHGHLEVVKLLLKHDQEKRLINAQTNTKMTALHLACIHNKRAVIQYLITQGADCSLPNDRQESPLAIIIRKNHWDSLQFFTNKESLDQLHFLFNGIVNTDNFEQEDWDVLEKLVQYCPALHYEFLSKQVDKNGNTITHIACLLGRDDSVSTFVKYGAQLTGTNSQGQDCMDLRKINRLKHGNQGDHEIKLLNDFRTFTKNNQYQWNDLIDLISNSPDPLKKYFLTKSVDKNRNTLLHVATLLGLEDQKRILIELGADTSRTNIFNQTAADLKIIHKFNLQKEFNNLVNMGRYRNNWDMIIRLIECAPQDCRTKFLAQKIDPNGNTLLHLACLLGQKHYSDQLTRLGAQMDLQNDKGQTCMDLQRIKDAQDRKKLTFTK